MCLFQPRRDSGPWNILKHLSISDWWNHVSQSWQSFGYPVCLPSRQKVTSTKILVSPLTSCVVFAAAFLQRQIFRSLWPPNFVSISVSSPTGFMLPNCLISNFKHPNSSNYFFIFQNHLWSLHWSDSWTLISPVISVTREEPSKGTFNGRMELDPPRFRSLEIHHDHHFLGILFMKSMGFSGFHCDFVGHRGWHFQALRARWSQRFSIFSSVRKHIFEACQVSLCGCPSGFGRRNSFLWGWNYQLRSFYSHPNKGCKCGNGQPSTCIHQQSSTQDFLLWHVELPSWIVLKFYL